MSTHSTFFNRLYSIFLIFSIISELSSIGSCILSESVTCLNNSLMSFLIQSNSLLNSLIVCRPLSS
ncbi:hypothetical protein pCPXV0271 [Cowpox virus]|uniref:Uncharacterized 7.2 kDa protein n=7 Tax=Orthopoxvirus TaxID=10242 RepID=YVCE_VACCC|nr:RecName: Full=Uncharacterized 7.2 kDa protein [Vaccinia virus Copenhagen]AAF33859.1 unknown [Vaccinia virus Tian Tan]AAW23400.1 hypothetical protein m8006R [Vaccinia virus]ABZ79911.1 unknown [synthetic Vaccinia virus]CUI02248.1 hypothetical protein pCPXV0271 [Cowpox virus]BBD06069.1 putative C ORF E [BAC cloning vector pLC16m8.8S-BAC]